MKKWICLILCLLTLTSFTLVLVQQYEQPFEMKPLKGYTTQVDKPELTFSSFASGEYQNNIEQYIRNNFGFREFFIRVYNQYIYSCYHEVNNSHVREGANHELFLKMYLDDITGVRLLAYYPDIDSAKASARANVEATLTLIDSLHSHGTDFLFVFAPSKTAVYPEWMPEKYQRQVSDFSLEEYYIQLFQENNLPYIDFLSYFRSIKNSFPYPLYTRTGTHWSEATIPMVADSILRKLEEVSGYSLPSINYIDTNLTTDYSVQDGELESTMNLLFPLRKPAVPKPLFALTDTLGKDHPNLLVIGDSYFVQLLNSCFVDAFHDWDYWQYNRETVSSRKAYSGKELRYLVESPEILRGADIVMAIFTAPCLCNYMYGFHQSAPELYTRDPATDEAFIQATMERIQGNEKWLQAVERQAEELGLTIEENLRRNAIYVINQDKMKHPESTQP